MAGDLVIVPCDSEGYVELARTKTGRLFRKHLLTLGDLRHPATGDTVKIDETFAKVLKKNFQDGICDTVAVPLADAQNQHSEDPERNIGEVVDVEVKDDKVYAILDIRDDKHADKLGKTYLGASAMLHLDYLNTKTGKRVGPTLLHACVTNRPYVTGLESYEEIVSATSDRAEGAVLLLNGPPAAAPETEETAMPPDTTTAPDTQITAPQQETPSAPALDELLTALKTHHGIDVTALQAQAAETVAATALSKTLVDALSAAGVVKLTADDTSKVSTEDIVGAVAELATTNVALTNRVGVLERAGAEHDVDGLIAAGRVLPAQKTAMVELKLTNPTMFAAIVPAEPIVKLDAESGVTPPDDAAHQKTVDDEIARLTAAYVTPVTK